MLLAFGLNINTLFNEYAVDDLIVMTQNRFVEKGIKGIPEIVSHNYFAGWNGMVDSKLSGGRYRPVALIIFALEHQFFGTNPMVSHLINVLLFGLLIALLFKLLQSQIFRNRHEYLAFVVCLLFAAHPIHTEVVANVKGRDEIITFIFLVITLITLIRHSEKRSPGILLAGLLCFILALFTRESAVTFIGVAPLIFYFFFNQTLKKSILISLPLISVLAIFVIIRYSIVGFSFTSSNDILFAPFLFATASQAFATKVFIVFKYILLLLFPHPLSSDYSFNQIPYVNLQSVQFIFSFAAIAGLITYAFFSFRSKSIYSFSILYFFVTLSLVANFVADVGTPLAERLLFQPSLGICFVLAGLYLHAAKRFRLIANSVLMAILLLYSVKTFTRNAEWENNETLYAADITNSPNSLRINLYLAESNFFRTENEANPELKKSYFKNSIYYAKRSLAIFPGHPLANTYLISSYAGILEFYGTINAFLTDNHFDPAKPEAINIIEALSDYYYKQGNNLYGQNNIDAALRFYQRSVELDPVNIESWYNLGGIYYARKDSINAWHAWEKVKQLNPNHPINEKDFLRK